MWKPRFTFHAPGSVGECEEWTSTLPSELPLWELESQWTPESSKNNCKGQNSLDWKFPYIIGKILKLKCLKWACMTHLDISNTSYGQKKGWKWKWQFDSQPLKFGNRPYFLVCRWRVTYYWKALDEGYNFALDLISIRGFRKKLWGPKVIGIPIVGISRLPLRSPRTKWHLGASPVARHRVYYKGEGGDFPQVQAMVSLVSPSLPMVRSSTISALIMQ